MAVEGVNETMQFVLATRPNIEQIKSEQEECLIDFIAGKDIVALLPLVFLQRMQISLSYTHVMAKR